MFFIFLTVNKSHEMTKTSSECIHTNNTQSLMYLTPLCHRPPLLSTIVYFDSVPHTPCCCCKYSLAHQMCINPLLKIVPSKCTIYCCLRNICLNPQCPAILGNYLVFFKNETMYFQPISPIFMRHQWL